MSEILQSPITGRLSDGHASRYLAAVSKNRALKSTYRPRDLVLSPYAKGNIRIRAVVAPFLEEMCVRCREEAGALYVVSGFRSYVRQGRIFESFVGAEQSKGRSRVEAEVTANRYSARAGHSEHQIGTAVDLSTPELGYELTAELANTGAGQWLFERAHRFGFVFSYPQEKEALTGYVFEPWHLRWIGLVHAEAVYRAGYLSVTSNVTVAAYLESLQRR